MISSVRSPGIIVIGGGLIGLASAYRLRQRFPDIEITVLEKEKAVGTHQSGHNSGVLHAGLYYAPGSAKARLAVSGLREMVIFCAEHGVRHEICGKLVVATNEEERVRLATLLERGHRNGLTGLRLMGAEEMREVEPHVAGVAAVHVPEEGIVDYPAVSAALARVLERNGVTVITSANVRSACRRGDVWTVETTAGDFEASFLLGCAGLHADRVARLTGATPSARIVPFRGEYYQLRDERRHLVRHLIYPVPDQRFPFLGVHFTRRVDGSIEAGPNAVLAMSREGYRRGAFNFRDACSAALHPGLSRFVLRYRRETWAELRRSYSRAAFAAALQRLVPEVSMDDLVAGGAGVRAQAMRGDGTLVEDFLFEEHPGALHVLNAPSPGATASLAIGGEIAARVAARMDARAATSALT